MTVDSRYGIKITTWLNRFKNLLFTQSSAMATVMARMLPNRIKPRLYSTVLRSAFSASLLLNRNLKLLSPAHGLLKMPTA